MVTFGTKHIAGLEMECFTGIAVALENKKALKPDNLCVHLGPTMYWLYDFGELTLSLKFSFLCEMEIN